jgi:hypothetical protein
MEAAAPMSALRRRASPGDEPFEHNPVAAAARAGAVACQSSALINAPAIKASLTAVLTGGRAALSIWADPFTGRSTL